MNRYVSFISWSWDSGVFVLRLDLSRWVKATPKKKAKLKGAKPLPPPFVLPPLKAATEEELADAPALREPPNVIVDSDLAAPPEPTVLMVTDDDLTQAPPDTRVQRIEVRRALAATRR
jgi:hypothetical protein